MAGEMDLANEIATLHETISRLERDKRRAEAEADHAARIIRLLRNTIDKLESTIISQAKAIDVMIGKGEADEAE